MDTWAPLAKANDPPVVHGMDWGHWASLMFEVAEIEPSSDKHAATMRFGRGGFQGAQGGNASNYYLENIKELLDDTHEFYYDAPSHTLFFQPNSTASPPSADMRFFAPILQTLISTNGTQTDPVVGISIRGLLGSGTQRLRFWSRIRCPQVEIGRCPGPLRCFFRARKA